MYNYYAMCRCEAGDLAGKFGLLMPNTLFNMTDETGNLFLRDTNSIVGRSVVIHRHDGSTFECGTIHSKTELAGMCMHAWWLLLHPSHHLRRDVHVIVHGPPLTGAEVTLLKSSFVDPIGGSIYFRQVEGEDVQIWGKLFWTNDSPTTLNHNWHIHSLAVSECYRSGKTTSTS